MTIECIIVDDEPIARNLLTTYISQIPYLHLVSSCADAFEAMDVLKGQNVDLIILDINMPHLSGLEMLKTLKQYPAVIITSAYPEYALEGFELSVTDYLLKPFSFARFVAATEKVTKLRQEDPTVSEGSPIEDFIMIKADKKLTRVALVEISYVEAYGNYLYVNRGKERILFKQTLTQFQEQLPEKQFIRVHKSFIVALKAIQYLEGNELTVGDKKIPVGKVYKDNVIKHFRKNSSSKM